MLPSLAGTCYLVVMEGYMSYEGAYSLATTCPTAPPSPPATPQPPVCPLNYQAVPNLLLGRRLTSPLPLAVEVEAIPASCQEETTESEWVDVVFPTCRELGPTSRSCRGFSSTAAPSSPWYTCRVQVNGYDAVVGTPVEPTHPVCHITCLPISREANA